MATDEARELFQTFSLLGSQMGEGYRQARKEEDEERRKARREQLLLTIFGPSIAEGVTSLIKAPFEEPVNKFLSTESTNIYDDDGNIVGQNRGGLDVKRFKSDVVRADQTITSIQKAAERGGFSSVQDYFADAGIKNVGGGIENIVGKLDYKVHGSFNGPNIDTTGKMLGKLDYDEYKDLVAWRSKFGTVEEIDTLIAEQNPVPKSFMQAAYKAGKRLLRRETKDTVRERSVRNLEEILGVELTAEGHKSFMDLVDRAARVGNVYDIPNEVERLVNHPDNVGFKELVTLRKGEAKARTQSHIVNRQFMDDARATPSKYGKRAAQYVSRTLAQDKTPTLDGFIELLRQDIKLPEWNGENQTLYSDIMQNDDSVSGPLTELRDTISESKYGTTYQELDEGGYDTDVGLIDAQLDRTLKSVFGAAQMVSARQIGMKLDDPDNVELLRNLGFFEPGSLKGRGLVLSNMREILTHHMGKKDVKTGWWLWSGEDERLTGGVDLPKILEETSFDSDKLNSATTTYIRGKPSEEDGLQNRVKRMVDKWKMDLDGGMDSQVLLKRVTEFQTSFNEGGRSFEDYRIAAPMLEWMKSFDPITELPAAEVQQYYARFIKGDPNLDIETDYPDSKIEYLAGDAREKLTKDLKSEWYDIGRPLYEERQSRQGDIQWENVKGWFQGRSRAERLAFEKEVADAGGSVLDLHQETFWNAKDVDTIAPLANAVKAHVGDHDVRSIADWFINNPQHLESLAENNYNLIDFVLRQQSAKK